MNTGLGAIGGAGRGDGGMALPAQGELIEEGRQFGTVSDQIAESARQLNVYFANMEIDGVDPVNPETHVRMPMGGESATQGAVTQVPVTEVTQVPVEEPMQQAVEPALDDGSVRVSLLSGSGDSQATEPAEDIQVEEAKPIAVDPYVRKEELARELAEILTSLASTSDDPGSAALALAGLEMLLPADTDSLVDEGVLSDGERASLDAARAFLRTMSSEEGSIASPGEVATGLEVIQAQLGKWAGLTIKKAALCTQVDGYGRYETFPSYRFIAGRAQQAIVYVELERFAQRESVGPDGQARFETKFSQRLELYHVADDLNTWNRAADTVGDVTRNRLRDYYLINQITLPANLGVGRYHLKVVTRDLIGEKVAESIIPIEIVLR
ncbi:hypothetical protein COB72_11240 [bacterium]|nr:MAG: hypothetical protein COB72_11240 [bacterium]